MGGGEKERHRDRERGGEGERLALARKGLTGGSYSLDAGQTHAGIKMQPEAAESGWLENIIIQNNVFRDVGYFIEVQYSLPPQDPCLHLFCPETYPSNERRREVHT
jgi:hypothetical protein